MNWYKISQNKFQYQYNFNELQNIEKLPESKKKFVYEEKLVKALIINAIRKILRSNLKYYPSDEEIINLYNRVKKRIEKVYGKYYLIRQIMHTNNIYPLIEKEVLKECKLL